MNIFFTFLAFLLLVFVIWQGQSVLPRVVTFLLPVKKRLYFEEDLPKPGDGVKRADVQPIIQKFESLGFAHIGLLVEKYPLWAGASRELIMVSSTSRAIVSLGFRRQQPAYYLFTPFTGGEAVITAFNSFRDVKKDRLVIQSAPSGEPDEMLAIHKQQVDKFKELGYTPFSDYSQESVIQANRQYYSSIYPKTQLRIAGVLNLLYLLVCLFLLAVLIRGAIA